MNGSAGVLQEYLIRLGYQTDQLGARRLTESLGTTSRRVLSLGTNVAGVVATVAGATAAFAYSMRKTFFAADLAGSSIKKMNSVGFAAKQIGIDADAAQGAVTNLARALRLDPGKRSWIEMLTGKATAGRDTVDVMNDLVKATGAYGEVIGSRMMESMGLMDPDTYHMWLKRNDEMMAAIAKADKMFDDAGINMDQLERDVNAVAGAFDTLGERVELSAKRIMAATQGPAKRTMDWLGGVAEWAAADVEETMRRQEAFPDTSTEGLLRQQAETRAYNRERRHEKARDAAFRRAAEGKTSNAGVGTIGGRAAPSGDYQAMAAQIAARYGLDPDTFKRQIATESAWNPLAVSRAGAQGLGQLMPGTAKAFGVADPFNPEQNLDASAKLMAQLLSKYGNYPDALSAYNRGEPKFDEWVRGGRRGAEPAETQAYRRKILGEDYHLGTGGGARSVTINAPTTITVQGATTPTATAQAVGREQRAVAASLIRNARSLEEQ